MRAIQNQDFQAFLTDSPYTDSINNSNNSPVSN